MAPIKIAPYEATPMEDIVPAVETARKAFRTNKTKNLEWRKVQLRKLYWAIVDFTPQLCEALKIDLNKPEFEATLAELEVCKNDCLFMLQNLDNFAKDEYLGSLEVPMTFRLANMRTHKEPLGMALIIGCYNFPLMLNISPFIGAIAAGCTAVIKPSELAPATAVVISQMVESCLDRSAFKVINGLVPETTLLLDQKWDKIFYTGSTTVAKIISRKAADNLTPVTLELGGRNPAFVTKHANLKLAARRLLWAKTHNAGQVCLSHNYVLVEKTQVDGLIEELKGALKDFFPDGANASNFVHIVNERHFLRMKKMLDDTDGKIVLGGSMDQSTLFMEPTVVLVNSQDDACVAQESFGPIFSIMPVNDLSEAISIANQVDSTPLSLFSFGSDAENNRVLNEVTSGGATFNDSFMHATVNTVRFGGVGSSGTGAYKGKASFDTFTHLRTVAQTPGWMEPFLRVRYMPYNLAELRRFVKMTSASPNFDRNGNVVRGLGYWAGLLFGLGAKSTKGVLLRWLVLAAAGYVKVYGLTLDAARSWIARG